MRLATFKGRAMMAADGGFVDVDAESEGRFGPEPQSVFEQWEDFRGWAEHHQLRTTPVPLGPAELGPPSPDARQVFGIGTNYRDHAIEAGLEIPDRPVVFPKFPSSIAGPGDALRITSDTVDWEVELVVIIGQRAREVACEDAWNHVAGLTIGQDISDRAIQFGGPKPQQFGLAKSGPGFAPTGPWLVTVDEFTAIDNLALRCQLNGETVQESRTWELIFGVPDLIAYLSAHVTLHPGDLIFTGTPVGVGMGRDPQRYLRPGDVLVSEIDGIGSLTTTVVGR